MGGLIHCLPGALWFHSEPVRRFDAGSRMRSMVIEMSHKKPLRFRRGFSVFKIQAVLVRAAAAAVLAFAVFGFGFVVATTTFAAAVSTTASAASMNMAMSKLLFSRITYFSNGHREIKVFACQWMIPINCNFLAFDFGDAYRNRPLLSICLKLHADLKLLHALKAVTRDNLLKRWIKFTIAIRRIDPNVDRLTGLLTFKCGLQTGNDVAVTVEISERIARLRLVDQSAFVVL